MTEVIVSPDPALEAASQTAQSHPALSRVALEGVGVAAQHYYGGHDHFIGRTQTDYRLIVTRPGSRNEAVGTGVDEEAALRHALEQMRSLETVQTKSLAHIEMTPTAAVDFTELAHYSPRVAPGSRTHPVPSHLDVLMTENVREDDQTYKNTVAQEGWQQEVRTIVDTYVANDPVGRQLMADLKIRSLNHLTPEQAVKLSAAVVQSVSKYSYDDLKVKPPTRADQATVPDLLTEGIKNKDNPNWTGNGVCRNIASSVKAVFESLKASQGELSMLNNTYAVFGGGYDGAGYQDKREDNLTFKMDAGGHAWDTFVTIDANGSAVATIIDATWALGRDAAAAMQHLDRTDVRAAAQVARLFEKSEVKSQAFEGLSEYFSRLVRQSAVNPHLTASDRGDLSEYATTQYLHAAAQLSEIPEGHYMPDSFMGIAYQMRGRLERREVAALYALVKAGGGLEEGRFRAVLVGYDQGRKVPLPDWKQSENLVFSDDELQRMVYESLGEPRVMELAEAGGAFRGRLRQLNPDSLPPFDPFNRRADSQELGEIASKAQIHERDPRRILQIMRRRIESLAGDPAVSAAILTGRSDYNLAVSFRSIISALRERQ